jgi:hypothetical protein
MTYRGRVENGVVLLDGGRRLPEGTEVSVQPLTEESGTEEMAIQPSPPEFWRTPTVDQLAKQQGVTAPTSLDDLAGDWPAEHSLDDFLNMVNQSRC